MSTKKTVVRVGIYCRVGSHTQMNIEKQKESLVAYAKQMGFEIAENAEDIGSGLKYDRQGLNEMIKAAQSHAIDAVLVKSLCRIGRDPLRTYQILEEFETNRVVVITPTEGEIHLSPMLYTLTELTKRKLIQRTF